MNNAKFIPDNLIVNEPAEIINSLPIKQRDISNFSSISDYKDDIWINDKYFPLLNCNPILRKMNFAKYPVSVRDEVKKYVYFHLLNNLSLEDLHKKLSHLAEFFRHVPKALSEITKSDIEGYYQYLTHKNVTNNVKFNSWSNIKTFLGYYNTKLQQHMELYPLKYNTKSKPNDTKYISDYTSHQLDFHMKKDDDVPLNYRLIYWILRLYPGRGTETVSYAIECLKSYHDSVYMLCTRVFKTAGEQNGTPKILMIDTSEATQKYLYDLIVKQQSIARTIYSVHPDQGDFLFLSHRSRYFKRLGKYIYDSKPFLTKTMDFNVFLRDFIKRKDIKDENGELAHVTSHMFRHNSTTDRVKTGIFRPIDLRPMTLHSNEEMFNKNYHNISDSELAEQVHNIESIRTRKEIIFKGRIINSANSAAYDYFLRKPFAFKINHMGICSNIRACSNNKWKCLACDHFIPNADDLPYFEEQKEGWKKKLPIAEKLDNKQMIDNIQSNITLFENVVERIKNGLRQVNLNDKI